MTPTPEQAVERAYRRYFAVISNKCARMLGDSQEAADVAQETFARLWEKRNTLRDPLSVTAWIYRTSTRLAIECFRRAKSEQATDVEPAAVQQACDNPELNTHVRRVLVRLSRGLSAREIEVLVLSRLDGLTQPEIAEVLECSERTVRRVMVRIEQHGRALTEEGAWR